MDPSDTFPHFQSLGTIGYWPSFLNLSTSFRESFKETHVAHATKLDSPELDAYSLWRGVVVPGFLSVTTYILSVYPEADVEYSLSSFQGIGTFVAS